MLKAKKKNNSKYLQLYIENRTYGHYNISIKQKENIKMDYKVTKDTLMGEILDIDKETAKYFIEMGMHCLGCPASRQCIPISIKYFAVSVSISRISPIRVSFVTL